MDTFDIIYRDHIYKNIPVSVALVLKKHCMLSSEICNLIEKYVSCFNYQLIVGNYYISIKNNTANVYNLTKYYQTSSSKSLENINKYDENVDELISFCNIEKIFRGVMFEKEKIYSTQVETLLKLKDKKYAWLGISGISVFETEEEIIQYFWDNWGYGQTYPTMALGETYVYNMNTELYFKKKSIVCIKNDPRVLHPMESEIIYKTHDKTDIPKKMNLIQKLQLYHI